MRVNNPTKSIYLVITVRNIPLHVVNFMIVLFRKVKKGIYIAATGINFVITVILMLILSINIPTHSINSLITWIWKPERGIYNPAPTIISIKKSFPSL